MPTQAIIPVTPGSGLDLDAVSLVIGVNTVFREVLVLADPTSATELATVSGGALHVSEAALDGCITANVLAVSLPTATVTTLTPPTAAAIAAAIVSNPPTVSVTTANLETAAATTTVWTSATPLNTILSVSTVGFGNITVGFINSGNTAGGVLAFECTVDGTTWIGLDVVPVGGGVNSQFISAYTLGGGFGAGTQSWQMFCGGLYAVRVRLSSVITNTGSATLWLRPSFVGTEFAQYVFQNNQANLLMTAYPGATFPISIDSGQIAAGAAAAGAFADGSVFVRSNAAATFPVTATIAASQTIAVTNTGTFVVQATLAAETTKVIGTVNQGTSPWVISGAVTTSGTVTATLNAETTKVIGTIRVIGNIGGVMDTTLGSTKPANVLQVGGNDGTNAYALPLASGGGKLLVTADAITVAAAQTLATVTTVGTVTTVTNPVLDKPAAPTTATWSQAAITFNSSGDNTLVAGVGGQTIRVMRIFFVNSDAATATNITIKDSTPTSFSGAFLLNSGGFFSGAPSGEPLFVTASGKGFQLNSSAAVQISGVIWYTIS